MRALSTNFISSKTEKNEGYFYRNDLTISLTISFILWKAYDTGIVQHIILGEKIIPIRGDKFKIILKTHYI